MSRARDYFRDTFGGEPDVIASAPGRVNLIGEHTDYNGGEVLPIAIQRRTQIALRAHNGAGSVLRSQTESEAAEFDARAPVAQGKWWDYVAGVCAAFAGKGVSVPQLEGVVASDVPAGAGLSSSAALEVATAFALDAITGNGGSASGLAMLAWSAETQFVGVACGVMDQYAAAMCVEGKALRLYCDTLDTTSVPMGEAVMIFDTAVPRSLRASEFNTRRAECEEALRLLRVGSPALRNLAAATVAQIRSAHLPQVLLRRALHVSSETRRVAEVATALEKRGTVPGDLLYDSHESLRTQYECSTPELDWFVENARQVPGIVGARLTGAGWGGCAIAVGTLSALEAARDDLPARYERQFGHTPRVWLTHAAGGARIEM